MTKKVFIITSVTALTLLISIILIMGIRIASLKRNLDDDKISYNRELENNKQMIDEISQNLQILSAGSNEIRRSLNLPEKDLIQNRSGENEESAVDPAVSFFDALRFLIENENEERAAEQFTIFISESRIDEYFIEQGYNFIRDSFLHASVTWNDTVYLSLEYKENEGSLHFSNILGEKFEIDPINTDLRLLFSEETDKYQDYNRQLSTIINSINKLIISENVTSILENKGLSFNENKPGNFSIINDKDESIIGNFYQNTTSVILNGTEYTTFDEFKESFLDYLNSVSNMTDSEKIDELVLKKMEEVFSDEGFKVLLETNNCKTDLLRREDDEFIYFDVYSNNGSIKGSFVLQKEFGEVLLLTGDGKYLKSLNMFTPGNDFRSLIIDSNDEKEVSPYVFDDSSENFLVVGTHEHNADTMIIVNANNRTGLLNMISVPRDLYYKGKKINNIYKAFGPERLASELSDITGLEIKKYISIDMFAFIDVVNILGGLDVTLEEDLIDPTYKVKNNGIWSTLYYRKGTHHLDGVAALRVARSRHGSDDFDRSKRQQQVIKSVFDKMKSLNTGDISKVYEFVTTVFSYIDTNLNPADIVKNYLMYKDNEIADPNIINTDNVLYATYTNLYLLTEQEKADVLANEDYYKGLWIVLPRNNDWNLIKKHIGNILDNG